MVTVKPMKKDAPKPRTNSGTQPMTKAKRAAPVRRQQIIDALQQVNDPEIGMSVWKLGLIYDILIDGTEVTITMTLTTPLCPYGPMLMDGVKDAIEGIKGVTKAEVNLVFEPPWKMPEDIRMAMGL